MTGKICVSIALIATSVLAGHWVGELWNESQKVQQPPFAVRVARNLLDELRREGVVEMNDAQMEAFLVDEEVMICEEYESFRAEMRESRNRLRKMIRSNYVREELESLIVEDPRVVEKLALVAVEYDGQKIPLPIDCADWPSYFKKHRYGYGAENGLKGVLADQLQGRQGRPGHED